MSDKPGLRYDMDLYDHAGLLKAVGEAKQEADLVVFTIHAHESPTGMDDDTPEPPDFLIKLFHNAVDARSRRAILGGRSPFLARRWRFTRAVTSVLWDGSLFHQRRDQGARGDDVPYVSRCRMAARPHPSLPSAPSDQAAIRLAGTTVWWP